MRVALFIDVENMPNHACAAEAYVRKTYGEHKSFACGSTAFVRGVLERLKAMGVEIKGTATGNNRADHVIQQSIKALIQREHPPFLVAIASGDGDFAPIARWLKEQGIQTLCIGQSPDKTARSSKKAFHDIVYLDNAYDSSHR